MTSRAPRRLPARDLALVAVFAALIAALGLPGGIYLFGAAVPITLQTLGVMLAGSLLGARRGALAVLLVQVLVAAGLPLLAGGRGGLAVFAGPSAGFLIGWLFGVIVIGLIAQRSWSAPGGRYSAGRGAVANLVGGIGVVYALGIPVLAAVSNISLAAAATGSLAFVPGDLLKAAIATAVAVGVHRAVPDLAVDRARQHVGV